MRKSAKECFAYATAVFLGYLTACGGGRTIMGGGSSAAVIAQMLSSNSRQTAVMQSGAKGQSTLAALLGNAGSARPESPFPTLRRLRKAMNLLVYCSLKITILSRETFTLYLEIQG